MSNVSKQITKEEFSAFLFWQTKSQNIKQMRTQIKWKIHYNNHQQKKKAHTNYASREMEFRINFIPCHFCHPTETFFKQTLPKFFQSQTGYHYSNRLFKGTSNKEVFLYKIYTQKIRLHYFLRNVQTAHKICGSQTQGFEWILVDRKNYLVLE